MKLDSLRPAKGSVKANDRVGRGHGSGGGGTAKRGHKGPDIRTSCRLMLISCLTDVDEAGETVIAEGAGRAPKVIVPLW